MTTPWKPLSLDECRDLPVPPQPEVEKLRKALVYVAFALHGTPQYMLAPGITLIDGDTVRVSRDGWTVEASTDPRRQPSAPSPVASVATLVARAGLYWDSYKAGFFVRDENDSGEACMARFARLVAESGGDIAAAASTKPCPTCSAPCETTVNPRGGEYGWGTTDAERTTYRYAGVVR